MPNVNTDHARLQTLTAAGRVGLDAGFAYPNDTSRSLRRSPVDRAPARIHSEPGLSNEQGQQASVSTNTFNYQLDGANWPGDVDYAIHAESNRNWYGGQYPSIPQGGVDILQGRRDLGGLPGSVDVLPYTMRGPVESNTVEDFTLYGDVLALVRPNVMASGPVLGGRDYRQQLTGALSQESVAPPLTVDAQRMFLMNQ